MKDNGMDRDIALDIVDNINNINTALGQINDNLYVPHIITQPESVAADLGDTITLTVIANNIKSYQWQYNAGSPGTWRNSSYEGNQTNTLTFELISARVGYRFRCILIGNDNSELITNIVRVTEASAA